MPSLFTFTFDSGSDTHLLTLEAARSLLSSQESSYLKVLGVSGVPQRADLQGNLIQIHPRRRLLLLTVRRLRELHKLLPIMLQLILALLLGELLVLSVPPP